MTLGPALLVPPWFDNRPPAWTRPLIEYGRVPFFYFFAHFSLLHAAAAVTVLVRYGSWHWMFESTGMSSYPFTRPPDWGYPLPVALCGSPWSCRSIRRASGWRRPRGVIREGANRIRVRTNALTLRSPELQRVEDEEADLHDYEIVVCVRAGIRD